MPLGFRAKHTMPLSAHQSLYELDALTRKRNASEMRQVLRHYRQVIGLSFVALLYAILSNGITFHADVCRVSLDPARSGEDRSSQKHQL